MKALVTLLLGALGLGALGCTTEAYCFHDCDATSGTLTTTTTTTGSGGEGGCIFNCTGGTGGGTGGAGPCEPTNAGIEKCDQIDNDCDGKIDNIKDLDLNAAKSCGLCSNNCYETLTNVDPDSITCTPSPNPGKDPGTCVGQCATDYYDLDGNGTCEYGPCIKTADDDTSCNFKDNDCDNLIDEDVDVCTSLTDCGFCGHACAVLHGTPECVHTGDGACNQTNTACQLKACDCTPGDCWWDLDGSDATGCEYQCELTNGGVEICGDGLDNDCDGKIDSADDLSGDPAIGVVCYGDPDGECGQDAHAGMTACQGTLVVCIGADVLVEDQVLETCNGKDDDCDGAVDDNPTDTGTACGQSNIFPCALGSMQCLSGALVCIGAIAPQAEVCNGQDDDCDGNIDLTGAVPPPDATGSCNVPPATPAGATQPCKAGMKACQGGTVVCAGSIGPTGAMDGCNDDSNCDGQLTNQPDLQSDVNHCGNCATNCYAGAVHAAWSCVAGGCQFQGCDNGYYDLNNDQKCEYACSYVQAQESCNGMDDNCNGMVDEGVVAPSPIQVCGVNPSATSPQCTTGVAVACSMGTWQCTFPAGICAGGCSPDDEICDVDALGNGIDNDCDGIVNENTPNFGKVCASDDGLPPPGHGACKTTGVYVCSGTTATACGAMKANCANLPGGCTELCDGIDNDCDGSIDEPKATPGMNAANYVKPVVTKVAPALWIYTYEASRSTATNITPGTGNGFQTSAPAGQTIDKTQACSAPAKVPWFNVTPLEVEQTCTAAGGSICTRPQWQTSCTPDPACRFGYNPRGGAGSACATGFFPDPDGAGAGMGKFCNLSISYDFDPLVVGDQDGLLPTASGLLQNCFADWSGLQGNVAATSKLFDLTGNLREITKEANNVYKLMGGAFNSQSEDGSECAFTFYTVDKNFKYFDSGFRCCFTTDPSN
jgi:hypothetical protein